MKKKLLPILISVTLISMISAGAMALEAKQNNQVQKSNQQVTLDPFDNDPFFQSPDDILKQMVQMQRAMDQFMKSQFSQMQHNLANQSNQIPFGSTNNIEIKESKNEIIYKIKLPKGADSKVDVSVKEGQLIVSSNITQKITRELDNSKSVSYSHSNYSQAFQIPQGYDPSSMTTKTKDSNLIVTFKKLIPPSSIL
ncbi:heat-shock protein Hsp20 [Legionella qingyii]|uniref:Heat-shock protein Hsp20 n=1 Tax=Legionella qingyii TaxID=2184757 RepID=A0A317U4Z6_9GAMM|nr:Hsp20/alpha crystallin family protein [Legionella qingyii]PWY55886.1 heat-shock protein Hsp20 [Legionella qingyii]RUR22461.1 Hsp20/alpha crystallin family protein [Legionella qingyii]RUR27933.1 Hsp20/alpha crystallin family protein [Legionella qingyii]